MLRGSGWEIISIINSIKINKNLVIISENIYLKKQNY